MCRSLLYSMAKRKRPQKKKYIKHASGLSVILIFLLLGLVLLWPYIRSAFLRSFVPIGRGTNGILEERATGDIIFSNGQTLLSAPVSGTITFAVENGDSVRVGDVIAEIGDPKTIANVSENLATAQLELKSYCDKTSDQLDTLTSNIQTIYQKAISDFYQMQTAFAQGDELFHIKNEATFKDKLQSLFQTRTQIMNLEDRYSNLMKEMEIMKYIVSSSSVKVVAPISGVFYSDITTFDQMLCSDSLNKMDASQLSVLSQNLKDAIKFHVEEGEDVEHGDVIGRIVSGEKVEYYLTVKTEHRPDIQPGNKVLLETNNLSPIYTNISNITDGKPPGYSIISGQIDYIPPSKYVRVNHASLITRREKGVIIPVKSLVDKNGQTGVLAVQKTYATFQPVDVIMIQGEQAIIAGIDETSEIVLNGIILFEGRRVR